MTERRVVADGWGTQASGSVFCADSSLRFIYETHQTASHQSTSHPITSLASKQLQQPAAPPQQQQQPTFFMDQLKGTASTNAYYANTTSYNPNVSSVYPLTAADDCKPTTSVTSNGKRARENSIDFPTTRSAVVDGVDLYEAEIARACTAITKRCPSLPHSFRECSVCLTANAYAQIQLCGHTFHSQCFLRWFRTNRSCPLCRGAVDAVQLAPVVSVHDELEAIMAEIDDEPLATVDRPLQDDDPLLLIEATNSDHLLSFLASDFDTDMDIAAFDELAATDDVFADGDIVMNDAPPTHERPVPAVAQARVPQPQTTTPTMQFAPSTTMPNYWNVLHQGVVAPPAVAPVAAYAPLQRMVPIAPKPDALTLPQQQMLQQQTRLVYPPRSAPTAAARVVTPSPSPSSATAIGASMPPRVVSCRCTGGCRNGRCACVKEGGMCGVSCRCTSCKNPFLMVKAAGANIDALLDDACFMHNVSKTRDMVQRLQEPVAVPCCHATIPVLTCVQGYECKPCKRRFDYSWCLNKLLDHDKTPRNHCAICKRCCDHRDVHCSDCGRCYFAGVAESLPCPCKEATHHKKRREMAEAMANGIATGTATTTAAASAKAAKVEDDDDEADGECCIM